MMEKLERRCWIIVAACCCKHYFPVKLNHASTVNIDEKQCTDFLVLIKVNYHVYLSSEIILKSDRF